MEVSQRGSDSRSALGGGGSLVGGRVADARFEVKLSASG